MRYALRKQDKIKEVLGKKVFGKQYSAKPK
jgi:hypothetical protein